MRWTRYTPAAYFRRWRRRRLAEEIRYEILANRYLHIARRERVK